MFNIDEFIMAAYLCVDAHLESFLTRYPPRGWGFAPGLRDSEVLTLEIVGEFLGHPDDSAIWRYFRPGSSRLTGVPGRIPTRRSTLE